MSDKRWEKVWASVGEPQGYFYEDEESQFNPAEFVEFFVEMWDDEMRWYSRIILRKSDLAQANIPMYQWTLDKMVEQIDKYRTEN